jgi:hypothetical protein
MENIITQRILVLILKIPCRSEGAFFATEETRTFGGETLTCTPARFTSGTVVACGAHLPWRAVLVQNQE